MDDNILSEDMEYKKCPVCGDVLDLFSETFYYEKSGSTPLYRRAADGRYEIYGYMPNRDLINHQHPLKRYFCVTCQEYYEFIRSLKKVGNRDS